MRRVIGMDIHRTFAEVVFWQDGRLCWYGRVDMTRAGLEGFGRGLTKTDEVVLEATGNAMAVVRVLRPYVARVIIANPLQVKAIAHARIKTDKIDAGVLASLHAAGFLPEVWLPDAETERRRRLVARRNQIVRHRTRVKNETHAILAAHLVPPCPHAELFNGPGRAWLARQALPDDERAAITRHLRALDRLGEDLAGARAGPSCRSGGVSRQDAGPLACLVPAHPRPARAPGRRRRDRTQDGGPRLASPRQGDRLPLGASGAGRPQAARSRAAGRPTDAERQPARPCLCL